MIHLGKFIKLFIHIDTKVVHLSVLIITFIYCFLYIIVTGYKNFIIELVFKYNKSSLPSSYT